MSEAANADIYGFRFHASARHGRHEYLVLGPSPAGEQYLSVKVTHPDGTETTMSAVAEYLRQRKQQPRP